MFFYFVILCSPKMLFGCWNLKFRICILWNWICISFGLSWCWNVVTILLFSKAKLIYLYWKYLELMVFDEYCCFKFCFNFLMLRKEFFLHGLKIFYGVFAERSIPIKGSEPNCALPISFFITVMMFVQ